MWFSTTALVSAQRHGWAGKCRDYSQIPVVGELFLKEFKAFWNYQTCRPGKKKKNYTGPGTVEFTTMSEFAAQMVSLVILRWIWKYWTHQKTRSVVMWFSFWEHLSSKLFQQQYYCCCCEWQLNIMFVEKKREDILPQIKAPISL